MNPSCKICNAPTTHFGEQLILRRHLGEYRRCTACGYLFVVNPHWLAEAYGSAITALDTGIVERNLWLADATCALLGLSLRRARRCVDYGGGSGLLVRLMRDRGHDFRWHDAYSPNLLAGGFEADLSQRYDLLTAFELVEHLPEPLDTFHTLQGLAQTLLISTELVPRDLQRLDPWWYFAPEAGQHIGFFTRRSLEVVAERHGRVLSSNGRNLHVMSDKRVSPSLLKLLRKPWLARQLRGIGCGASLARTDAAVMLEQLQTGQQDRLSPRA